MKINKLHFIVMMFAALLLQTACSSDDDSNGEPTKIILTASDETVATNFEDKVTFKIVDEYDKDWTNEVRLYLNGELYETKEFATKRKGDYTFKAKLSDYDLVSNELTITAEEKMKSTLIGDKKEARNDGIDKVILRVFDNKYNDVTDEAKIYADDKLLEETVYSSTKSGKVTFRSEYKGQASNFEVDFNANAKYTQRVLVEDYTGTWCQNCPRMALSIREAMSKDMRVVPIAVHVHKGDPYENRVSRALDTEFNLSQTYPAAFYNRSKIWGGDFTSLKPALESTTTIGILIDSEIKSNGIGLKVKLFFEEDFNSKLNLITYLVEDKLVYPQAGATEDYVHNHVVRASLTDIFGDEISQDITKAGKTHEVNIDQELDLSEYIKGHCSLVTMVVNADTKEVINVQHAKLGEQSGY
jgi:hypothetical protein